MKKKTIIKTVLLVILTLILILFCLYCLIMSFVMLNAQNNDWVRYNSELLDEIPLEKTREIADSEAKQIIYKFPLIPYTRVKATYIDDGSMTKEELKSTVEKIVEKSDKEFGGNKSKVIVEQSKNGAETFFYVQIQKRCRSLFGIFDYPRIPFSLSCQTPAER